MPASPLGRIVAAVACALVTLAGCGDGGGGEGLRIETVAGGLEIGDGAAATATFLDPRDVAVDARGDVFVVDANEVVGHGLVRRVDARTGTITTVGGPCDPRAPFELTGPPRGICDLLGLGSIAVHGADEIFVSTYDNQVFGVDARLGTLAHLAGRGGFDCADVAGAAPPDACLGFVGSIARDGAGDLYLAEPDGGVVNRLGGEPPRLTHVAGRTDFVGLCKDAPSGAGDLLATDACLHPDGIAIDRDGSLLVASRLGHQIRRVDPRNGLITTIAGAGGGCDEPRGDGGPAALACFVRPDAVVVASDGTLVVADDDRIRRIDRASTIITTSAQRTRVTRLAAAPDGSVVFTEFPGLVSRLDLASGTVTPVAGNGSFSVCGEGGPADDACLGQSSGIALGPEGSLYVADGENSRVARIDAATDRITTIAGGRQGFCGDGGPALDACFRNLSDVICDPAGNLYVADRGDDDQGGEGDILGRVRRIDAATGIVTTLAGNCTRFGSTDAGEACLLHPSSLLFDASGGLLVGGEDGVHRIDPATRTIRDVVGGRLHAADCRADGIAALDACVLANDLALDAAGNLYVLDGDGSRVHRIDAATGVITTVAGNGVFADCPEDDVPATSTCLSPYAIAIDAHGRLIVASAGVFRVVDLATGLIHTVAGSPRDCITSTHASDRCVFPSDVELDGDGRLLVIELGQRRIRRVTLP